jgi:hypothetical protein
MSHKFFGNASLHALLFALDQELAGSCRQSGCWFCGCRLHASNYPRKARGVPPPFQDCYAERLSFTCAECRRRCTPPSVRFFGRVRFVAAAAILIAALTRGPSERRCRQLERCFGLRLSISTWTRWRRWWRERFKATRFWMQARGQFAEPAALGRLPAGLLGAFEGFLGSRLLATLRFLSPLTGGDLRAV